MAKKISPEQAALALLSYVNEYKETVYIKALAEDFVAMPAPMQSITHTNIVQQEFIKDFGPGYKFKVIPLCEYEKGRVHPTRSEPHYPTPQERAENKFLVHIPLKYNSGNEAKFNQFGAAVNQFFHTYYYDAHAKEARSPDSADSPREILLTYAQYAFLKDWARTQAEAKGWHKIKQKLSNLRPPDVSDVLQPSGYTRSFSVVDHVSALAPAEGSQDDKGKPSLNIVPIGTAHLRQNHGVGFPKQNMGQLVSHEELQERRRRKKERSEDPERSL